MKVSFFTLGCKVNQYETEAMREKFLKAGYDASSDDYASAEESAADIYVINTCTVTNLADRKSRQFIRRAKKENPNALIAVTGCYAQIDPDKVAEIPGVDIIAGTNEKGDIVSYVEEALNKKAGTTRHIREYSELTDYCSDGIITAMESRTRAFVKIQEGCNRFCSYCIIPYARGKVRSREEGEIIEEVKGLVNGGFKEIVLTGINTALYGEERRVGRGMSGNGLLHEGSLATKGLENSGLGLRTLLGRIDEIPGDFRIRLSSLEPTVVGINEVESILDSKRLCSHLHLSIQSGSDKILKSMNRRYTRSEYLDIVRMLRERDPHFGITTDIIVGFPGESDEDFQDSLDLVKIAVLSKVHVFRYSPRKGTPAADMTGQVPEEEKSLRSKALSQAALEASKAFLSTMKREKVKVLVEEKSNNGIYTGYSENYTKIYLDSNGFNGSKALINNIIDVTLLNMYKDGMKGEV